jgi:glycosyltransferase involved in cell wall biosynthesis
MSLGQKRKVLIVGGFTFARGEAGSNYVIGLGKAIENAGFCVQYLADDESQAGVREDFKGFMCHSAPRPAGLRGWRAAIANICALESGLLNWLTRVPANEFQTIIAHLGGLPVAFLVRLHRLCGAKGWTLAIVVGEWQGFGQSGELKLHHRIWALVDSEIQRRIVNKRVKHIVAISRFLERYYTNSGCDAVLVPPLIDCRAKKWHCRPAPEGGKRGVKLLFSGNWWRDRLDLIAEALVRLRAEGHEVVLEFLGSGPNDFERKPKLRDQILNAPEGTFRFHGQVPVEKVLPIAATADFGILLRDRVKWSDACFPSKVAEFQALGVPLLCNLTSNLEEVLRDGENALVVPEVSVLAFMNTVKRALALSVLELQHMKQRSMECAATRFDYRVYSDSVGQFIRQSSNI